MDVRGWITRKILEYLTEPLPHYQRFVWNDPHALRRHIRKGDVLLVDGDSRVSQIIKYLTQSCWSHAALYVGDELLRRGGETAERAREAFGEDAEHLLVEALPHGVVASPLSKYIDYNIRIARPHRLRPEHLKVIVDDAIAAIGWRYDLRNVIDLALHLGSAALLPPKRRKRVLRFGSGAARSVICTSLLGQLFAEVGFPVLPQVTYPDSPGGSERPARRPLLSVWSRRAEGHESVLQGRHPTLLMPRDFDLSPFFQVVKVGAPDVLDYERITWEDEVEDVRQYANLESDPHDPA